MCGKDGDQFGSLQWHRLAAAFALGNTSYIKHISFQNLWRCPEQFPGPSLAPLSPTSHPSVPGSHRPDLTDIVHVHVCGCSAKCTCKAGPQSPLAGRSLPAWGTWKCQYILWSWGKECLQPGHISQGRPGAPPALTRQHWPAECAAPAHGSPSPQFRCPAPALEPSPSAPPAPQAGIPLVSLTSYLKMRQPPLQTRPQFRLNDWLFLN